MSLPDAKPRRGGVKFALLHHGGCDGTERFHYRVDGAGRWLAALDEEARGQHPRTIDVLLEGDFDRDTPSDSQMEAVKRLLLELKLRYPLLVVGAHRQVRGQRTTCPGRRFPMRALAAWAQRDLLAQRDARLAADVERQYSRI